MSKLLKKTTSIDFRDITLLCMTCWTFLTSSTTFGTRIPNASTVNGINMHDYSIHAFSHVVSLDEVAYKEVCPPMKKT